MKKVSIIIPMYNSEKHIIECINSVINQTYKNLEIIIIDDKSTDNSIKLASGIKDNRIKIIKLKENKGVANARNVGIKNASGELLCFLDSDDYWKNDKIEKQVKYIEKNEYTFIYSDYSYLKNGKEKRVIVPKSISYKQAIKNTTIFTSTVMFNMKNLKKDDLYMDNLKIGEDTLCWWRILEKGDTAYGINEPLAIYRISSNSLSSNKIKAVKGAWKIYKIQIKNPFKRLYYFNCYLFNATKRRL